MSETGTAAVVPAEALHTDPRGFVVKALMSFTRGALPAAAVLFGTSALGAVMIVISVGIVAAISAAIAWITWRHLTYTTGPEDIRVEHGLFSRNARSVPYERIQDVSIEQKWLPRLFGLAEVKFETGAGGKEEISLAYLSLPEAARLRELVRERKEGVAAPAAQDAAQPIPAEAAPADLLFAMDNRRLVLFGLFEFSLIIFAILLGAAEQFNFLPDDMGASQWHRWFSAGEDQIAGLATLGLAAQVAGAVAAIGAVLLLGLLTGVVRTVARDYGFRLERTAKGFRRRRGLFNKSDVLLPVHRVQASLVRTGLIRRRFGWHGLEFVSLAQDGAKTPHHSAVPFARLEEIWPVVRAAGIEPPGEELAWHRASPRPWLYDTLFHGLFFAVVGTVAALVLDSAWPFVAGGVAALGTALLNHLGWRRHRHAIDPAQLFVRQGRLAPKLTIAPQVKLQSAEIVQSPLGRWRDYATLKLGLAGGRLDLHGLPLAEAQAIRRTVLASIASVDFSRLNDAAG